MPVHVCLWKVFEKGRKKINNQKHAYCSVWIPLKELEVGVVQILPAIRTFRRWGLKKHKKNVR